MARKKMIISIKKRRATDSSLFVIPCFVFDFMVTNIILVKTVNTNVMQLSWKNNNVLEKSFVTLVILISLKILGLGLVEFGVEIIVGH